MVPESGLRRRRPAGAIVAGALALAALWVAPALLFPNPGANDAPILWNLPIPVIGATLVAAIAFAVRARTRRRPGPAVAMGVFLAGCGLAFVVGLVTVANLQNDRFWPFLLSPVVLGAPGIVILAIGGTTPGAGRAGGVVAGLAIGAAAAVVFTAWILARGARDWLLAPYGFDVCLLIPLGCAASYLLAGLAAQGSARRDTQAPGERAG